ncbi:MAG: proline racemase family protein [Shewanella sp.]|nr:proline racemase family protein [Shewanella sp.]
MGPFQISDRLLHDFNTIITLDAHTEGEPLRIVTGGFPDIIGRTILEKRQYVTEHLDWYRQVLMFEPRGHADMYGALITEPVTPEADFGVLFLHNEGYSSMCGHAILAIVKVACQTGAIELQKDPRIVKIDAPAGLIVAKAYRDESDTIIVSFENVSSWAEALNCSVYVEGIGEVKYDIGFGGAYYAFVDADEHGISCDASNVAKLIDAGRRIKQAVMVSHPLIHPTEADLSFLYGTIFTSKHVSNDDYHSKHVCVFADGEVDRSPTGTGVSARVALLYAKGVVALNEQITIESIVGGKMTVSALNINDFFGKKSVIPEVSGRSYITGQHQFLVDKEDVFQNGFLVR